MLRRPTALIVFLLSLLLFMFVGVNKIYNPGESRPTFRAQNPP